MEHAALGQLDTQRAGGLHRRDALCLVFLLFSLMKSWVLVKGPVAIEQDHDPASTLVDPASTPTPFLGRSTLGRGTRHGPRFRLL